MTQADPIEAKLTELGLTLPASMQTPAGARLPFMLVRVRGNRAYISGHGPLEADGSLTTTRGKLGAEVTTEQGYELARQTALAMLRSLKDELGSLDRVTAWLRVFGMVNSAPGFDQQPAVINGCSDLLLQVYGEERGGHTRSAVGMAELPFGIPVEIEAEVEISG